ncbi:MAG: repeat containing protein [Conexibacter sp.]|nr:repeat containing protein [Conexibacter sp.]
MAVTTGSAQSVTATEATLRAKFQALLGGSVDFEYGTTTAYGSTTGPVSISGLLAAQVVTVRVTRLQPSTTYHLRAVAGSALEVAYGRDVTFVTGAPGATPTSGPDDIPGIDDSAGPGPSPDDPAPAGSGAAGSGSSGSDSSGSGSAGSGSAGSGSTGSGSTGSGSTGSGEDAGRSPTDAGAAPKPMLGRTVAAAEIRGSVIVTTPSGTPVGLGAATALPSGTVIDTRNGTVELTSALDRKGATQKGRFWGGVFEVRQSRASKGLTQLSLRGGDFSSCGPAGGAAGAHPPTLAHAAAAAKPPRSLWGSDHHGRFQTRGRGSVATVRGTRWLTEDRCDGTLTRVVDGAVAVRDLRRSRTVLVTRGHRYLARVKR